MFPIFTTLAAPGSTTSDALSDLHLLAPATPNWIIHFLLLVLWLFVAAILLGPLIRHFNLEPTNPQYFADDRSAPGPHR